MALGIEGKEREELRTVATVLERFGVALTSKLLDQHRTEHFGDIVIPLAGG